MQAHAQNVLIIMDIMVLLVWVAPLRIAKIAQLIFQYANHVIQDMA